MLQWDPYHKFLKLNEQYLQLPKIKIYTLWLPVNFHPVVCTMLDASSYDSNVIITKNSTLSKLVRWQVQSRNSDSTTRALVHPAFLYRMMSLVFDSVCHPS